MQIEITEPATEEEFAEYYRLRYEGLRRPLGQEPGTEREDPLEEKSKHLIAKVDGRVVGAMTWVALTKGSAKNPQIYVQGRQTAIEPEYQHHGIGVALLAKVEELGREMGAVEYIGYVRVDNVPWAMKIPGARVLGKGPKMGDIDHMLMGKPLG